MVLFLCGNVSTLLNVEASSTGDTNYQYTHLKNVK